MASEKHSFKPPKPRPYTGIVQDKDPEVFEQWKQELLDYYAQTNIPPSTQIQALGYFVSYTAKDYYFTTRNKQTDITLEQMLNGLKKHVIPSTHMNTYWKQWDAIHQIKNGKAQRIGNVAIEIDKIAQRLGGKISDDTKLQNFLDVMHKELRYAIEPNLDKDNFKWEDVVSLAEKHDDSLWQVQKYGHQGTKKAEAFVTTHKQPNHQNKKKRHIQKK